MLYYWDGEGRILYGISQAYIMCIGPGHLII